MDALDVKILRALLSERSVAPSRHQVSSSLRSIASRLGADDVTVAYRYKKLRESGALSGWRLAVNPTFLGCRLLDVTGDVEPESAKPDMIRRLSLMDEVAGIQDFYGTGLRASVAYGSEDVRSRVLESISQVTNAEVLTQVPLDLPPSQTERLTGTDVAIIRALSQDVRTSLDGIARQLGLSARTVRSRVEKLRRENTIHAVPTLNWGAIPGLLAVRLEYSYSDGEAKPSVDGALLSRFEACYLSAMLSDPHRGSLWLSAATMADVQRCLEWATSQPGVAGARTDILVSTWMFPDKLIGRLRAGNGRPSAP